MGDNESPASRIKARVKGATPWTNSAPPSAGYPNSWAGSNQARSTRADDQEMGWM